MSAPKSIYEELMGLVKMWDDKASLRKSFADSGNRPNANRQQAAALDACAGELAVLAKRVCADARERLTVAANNNANEFEFAEEVRARIIGGAEPTTRECAYCGSEHPIGGAE